ncbi:hypothetical protein C2845_PM03G11130 [Panicum miliaceum]|uniref:CCHC-type domain-containing protein n=1 Tax=Panicum miliaceum TaxID=4540 RepID=A0A3L6TC43_PANMI|nr:hypothetical protein C2845_PM03G11130 [Panicum miliaceum]
MNDDQTMRQMYDRLMILVSDIRGFGCEDWEDHKVIKKLFRVFTPRNLTLTTMIRGDPKFKIKTPNQLLDEILHQELVERDVAKSFSHKVNKSVTLNATSSNRVGSSSKAPKSTKEDSSDEGSTDEEMALVLRNFKHFMKKKSYKRNGDDKKRPQQRRCYVCKEVGHYIADCPQLKNRAKEEKKYKEKSKNYKKKYQDQAHVGKEWESSHEGSDHEGITTLAMSKSTRKLFKNLSDDEDDAHFCLMARATKVQETIIPSFQPPSTFDNAQNDLEDEEEQHKPFMIK